MLFRREAIEAQRTSWIDPVRVQNRTGYLIPGLVAGSLTLSLVLFCLFFTVPRKILVSGHLEPPSGLVGIHGGVQGTLLSVEAADGADVKRGAALFRIATDKNIGDGSAMTKLHDSIAAQRMNLEHEIGLRRAQQEERRETLNHRLDTLSLQKANLSDDLVLARKRLEVTAADLERTQELRANGLVVQSQVLDKELAKLDARSRVAAAERSIASIELDIQTTRSDLEALRTKDQSDIEELERNLASTDQAAIEATLRRGITVSAPVAGRVFLRRRSVGESVQPDESLATLIPASDLRADGSTSLVATLYAPSRSVGFLRKGLRLTIRYPAFPYEKYGTDSGEILSVSEAPVALRDLPEMYQRLAAQRGADSENYYKIVASVSQRMVGRSGAPTTRKPGMTLEADVLQDERKVWEIIFDPLMRSRSLL